MQRPKLRLGQNATKCVSGERARMTQQEGYCSFPLNSNAWEVLSRQKSLCASRLSTHAYLSFSTASYDPRHTCDDLVHSTSLNRAKFLSQFANAPSFAHSGVQRERSLR